MAARCSACSWTPKSGVPGLRAYESHVKHNHCQTAIVRVNSKKAGAGTEIGRSVRPAIDQKISCIYNCPDYSEFSWRSVEGHLVRKHSMSKEDFTTQYELFPPTAGVSIIASSELSHPPSAAGVSVITSPEPSHPPPAAGVSVSTLPEPSPPPPEIRATRPRTARLSIPISSRSTPYERRTSGSPSPSRSASASPSKPLGSPSPSRSVSASPSRPSGSFSVLPSPSPLVHLAFSQPTSPQPQHEREDESMGSGSSRSSSRLWEGQMEVSDDDGEDEDHDPQGRMEIGDEDGEEEEDSDEDGEEQGDEDGEEEEDSDEEEDEEWEEQEVDTGGDEEHSPGLSSDSERHMDVDLTEGSIAHLDLTAGLAGGSMIEPTAVLAGDSMIEPGAVLDGGSMIEPGLITVSAGISMSEPALGALNLTAVSIESSIIERALEAASLIVVELKWLPDPCPKFIACKACQVGVNASVALKHAKDHKILLSSTQLGVLKEFLKTEKLAVQKDNLPLPPENSAPIKGLAVNQGFKCSHCSYCVASKRTIMTHFSKEHSGKAGTYADNSTSTSIQKYFSGTHSPSFPVESVRTGLASDDLYSVYLDQMLPVFRDSTLVNEALSPNEIPPLLKVTHWHQHLAEDLKDTVTIAKLMALTKVPTSKEGIPWLGVPLKEATVAYLHDTGKKAGEAEIGVRCLLHECPRTTQTGDAWQPLDNEKSIESYALLLHKWVHAILVTLEPNEPSGYMFPLTHGDRVRAAALKIALQSEDQDNVVLILHQFLKPLFYPLDRSGLDAAQVVAGKWGEVNECLQALTALQSDGTFKEAHNVTQMYAKLCYHIRAAILYEGYLNADKFGGDLYESVKNEALLNLQPGVASPYNNCRDYQRYASAIALNTNTAPTTRVSQDGMSITFGEHTLNIAQWRQGLAKLADEIDAELTILCRGQEKLLSIPDSIPDDWDNKVRGYGWTQNGKFLDDNNQLLHVMMDDKTLQLATMENKALKFNPVKLWEFLRQCDSVNEKLSLLAFMTPGQTPRVEEFLEAKYTNSTKPRTVFRDGQDIWIVTRRVKTTNQIRKEAFLPMKCPPRLTNFLERYLLVVRPIENQLIYQARPDEGIAVYHLYSEYLWTSQGARRKADKWCGVFKAFLGSYCKVDTGVHDYRQIAVEIGRVFLGSEAVVDEEREDVIAEQAGHMAGTARVKYAAEVGHLPAMSSDLLLRYGRVSELWWQVTGFMPNAPPMLPLRTRIALRKKTQSQSDLDHYPSDLIQRSAGGPSSDLNRQAIIHALTASLVHQIQQVEVELRADIISAVTKSLQPIITLAD
ncbi:uncharacterized protein LACBIDRAFT_313486 [Laccaria bicolor S238N-H82]|uniref:Predicted protein n=1 Tax=Laccaria bicolor (strain S238N-H82 / ATCC MYA-4686) TaxID=486041 RepID=B0D044_LACBS|nr:uncharacterized protein LACBIDRAFT_313486 [Laccaria bicolor S238N-H82]EDR11764.1 predicted protein [Laccaria bicolor S238N-H82]|eukprot:XP_001877661.1 predicted protein [Laccaria bicolor S238N-H82]